MFYTIYQTTNRINGKFYVGKHKTDNLNDSYIGSGLLLWRAIDKYGIENFEKKILFLCKDEDEMDAKEREIVNEEFVARDDTYNITLGGSGGWYHCSGENSNNIGNHRKTGFLQYLDKGINPWKEWLKNATDEEIKRYFLKVSEGLKNYYKEHGSWWKGRHHSEETKQKLSEYRQKFHPGAGSKNSQFGKHWWKDPKDKTKTLSIKDGDPIPEGWIRGRWCLKVNKS